MQKLKWCDPLDLAYQISISDYQKNWIFLYSGLNKTIKNSKSYLGLYPIKEIISDGFDELENTLQNQQNKWPKWFGYFSYNLKNQLENLTIDQKSLINLPNLWMINFGLVLEFDHDSKTIFVHQNQSQKIEEFLSHYNIQSFNRNQKLRLPLKGGVTRCNLGSNFSKSAYLQKVKTIQKYIADGKIYQANLTRKFFGKFTTKPQNSFEIFLKLNAESPANYSSFLKLGEHHIISSSPELFLKIDPHNNIPELLESDKICSGISAPNKRGVGATARKNKEDITKSTGLCYVLSSPIKGTAKKFRDKKLDENSKRILQNSAKEKAENLMIVDLVRNDISKHCLSGSVQVKNMFKISSYKTLHHLSSDICGIKKPSASNLDVIKSCFPAGSMTGAPKIKAMEICSELEKQERGIYSGAIGFVDQNSCELSVVIRTLIIKDNQFEFQVGGAITFDSEPQQEWQETINKAKGIAKTLGIKLTELKKI